MRFLTSTDTQNLIQGQMAHFSSIGAYTAGVTAMVGGQPPAAGAVGAGGGMDPRGGTIVGGPMGVGGPFTGYGQAGLGVMEAGRGAADIAGMALPWAAMLGAAPSMFDPFTGMAAAGRGLARTAMPSAYRGMGFLDAMGAMGRAGVPRGSAMLRGIAGGGLAMGGYMAAGAAVNWTLDQMITGAQQNFMLGGMMNTMANRATMPMMSGAGMGGLGGPQGTQQIAEMIRSMQDFKTGFGELTQLLQGGLGTGFFQDVQNVQQFKTRYRQLIDVTRQVATAMGTSNQEAMATMGGFRAMGFMTPQQAAGAAISSAGWAGAMGMAPQQMAQVGMQGAGIARQFGGVGRQGAMATQQLAAGIGIAQGIGAVPEDVMQDIVGAGGPTGAAMLAGRWTQHAFSMMRGRRGRTVVGAMMDPETGEIDPGRAQAFASGQYELRDLRRMYRENMRTRESRMAFRAHRQMLTSSLIEQMGPQAAITRTAESMMRGRNLGDPNAQEVIMQRVTGMGEQEARLIRSFTNRLPGLRGEMQSRFRQALDESIQAKFGREKGAWTMIKRWIHQNVTEKITQPLREFGAELYTGVTETLTGAVQDWVGARTATVGNQFREAMQRGFYGDPRGALQIAPGFGQMGGGGGGLYGGLPFAQAGYGQLGGGGGRDVFGMAVAGGGLGLGGLYEAGGLAGGAGRALLGAGRSMGGAAGMGLRAAGWPLRMGGGVARGIGYGARAFGMPGGGAGWRTAISRAGGLARGAAAGIGWEAGRLIGEIGVQPLVQPAYTWRGQGGLSPAQAEPWNVARELGFLEPGADIQYGVAGMTGYTPERDVVNRTGGGPWGAGYEQGRGFGPSATGGQWVPVPRREHPYGAAEGVAGLFGIEAYTQTTSRGEMQHMLQQTMKAHIAEAEQAFTRPRRYVEEAFPDMTQQEWSQVRRSFRSPEAAAAYEEAYQRTVKGGASKKAATEAATFAMQAKAVQVLGSTNKTLARQMKTRFANVPGAQGRGLMYALVAAAGDKPMTPTQLAWIASGKALPEQMSPKERRETFQEAMQLGLGTAYAMTREEANKVVDDEISNNELTEEQREARVDQLTSASRPDMTKRMKKGAKLLQNIMEGTEKGYGDVRAAVQGALSGQWNEEKASALREAAKGLSGGTESEQVLKAYLANLARTGKSGLTKARGEALEPLARGVMDVEDEQYREFQGRMRQRVQEMRGWMEKRGPGGGAGLRMGVRRMAGARGEELMDEYMTALSERPHEAGSIAARFANLMADRLKTPEDMAEWSRMWADSPMQELQNMAAQRARYENILRNKDIRKDPRKALQGLIGGTRAGRDILERYKDQLQKGQIKDLGTFRRKLSTALEEISTVGGEALPEEAKEQAVGALEKVARRQRLGEKDVEGLAGTLSAAGMAPDVGGTRMSGPAVTKEFYEAMSKLIGEAKSAVVEMRKAGSGEER